MRGSKSVEVTFYDQMDREIRLLSLLREISAGLRNGR
jgi:hypothetical protein